jgi:flagellar hook-associated protein 3 FlgL
MIRTTRLGMLDTLSAGTARLQARQAKLETQAVTGLAINAPSDAPSRLGEVHRMRAAAADQEVYQSTAGYATELLDYVDATLGQASDLLARAKEIAMQMASDTISTDERTAAADEIASLKAEMVALANTDFDGRYVFAGVAFDTPPFDDDGVYSGSSDVPEARVGADTWVATGMDGSAVFDGEVDVFGTLTALQAALESDDADAVSATLGDLADGVDALTAARVEAGISASVAEDAVEVSETMSTAFQSRLDALTTADPTETYLELSTVRSAYTTAIQVAASASTRTLFDLLG